MSKVEGLLRLAHAQGGDEVVLRDGAPPAIRVGGASKKLSMPVMDRELVVDALREIVGARADASEGDDRFLVAGAHVRVRWRLGDRAEAIFPRSHKPSTTASVRDRSVAAPRAPPLTEPTHAEVPYARVMRRSRVLFPFVSALAFAACLLLEDAGASATKERRFEAEAKRAGGCSQTVERGAA